MNITTDEAVKAIAGLVDPLPLREPGWVDTEQMAQAWGISHNGAMKRIRALMQRGKVEKRLVYDPVRRVRLPVYRVTGSKD